MKKKLFQIFMLLTTVVSIGAFVSCKDTNEDLYNELRTQTNAVAVENADLKTAIQNLTTQLTNQITNYENLLKTLTTVQGEVTTIGESVNNLDDKVTDNITVLEKNIDEQIKTITDLLETLSKAQVEDKNEIATLKAQVANLAGQITANATLISQIPTLTGDVASLQTLTGTLADRIKALEAWKETVKQCNCEKYTEVLETVAKLQQEMTDAQKNIEAAMEKATKAEQDAATAAQNAAVAKTIADAATKAAANAMDFAQTVDEKADLLGLTANEAKNTADKAYELATQAIIAANAANGLATQVATLSETVAANGEKTEANTKAIDELKTSLQTNTETITKLINDNKTELQSALDNLSERVGNAEQNIATNIADIKNNADKIKENATKISENATAIAEAKSSISDLGGQIEQMNNTLSLMSDEVKAAFKKASEAAAEASNNKANIAALQEIVKGLQTQIDELKGTSGSTNPATDAEITNLKESVSELKTSIQNLNTSLSDLISENSNGVSANAADIRELQTALNDLKDAGNKTDDAVKDLTNRVNDLLAELKELEGTVDVVWVKCQANLEEAKLYADAQIAVLETKITDKVTEMLKEYLKSAEVDLTKYVTKEEVANYIQKDELDKYALKEDIANFVSQEDYNRLSEQLEGMASKTELQAAIELAIANLTTEMTQKFLDLQSGTIADMLKDIEANKTDIAWLKELWEKVEGKVDGIDGKVGSLESWKEQINAWKETVDAAIAAGGGTVTQEVIETITEQITKDLNSQIIEIKEDLTTTIKEDLGLSDDFTDLTTEVGSIINTYNFLTADDIPAGLAEALVTLKELEDKINGTEDTEGLEARIAELETTIKDLATLTEKVNTLESALDNYATLEKLNDYATKDDIKDFATKDDIKDFLKESDLTNYIKLDQFADLVEAYGYLTDADLQAYGYQTKQDLVDALKDYATKEELKDYATKEALAEYAKTEDLNDYVKNSELDTKLSGYATKGDLDAYAKAEDLELYAKLTALDDYLKISDFEVEKKALTDAISTNATDIKNLQDGLDGVNSTITGMQEDINGLKDRVDNAEAELDRIEKKFDDAIDKLNTDIATIQNNLGKLVTGIQIQGTNNPLFGSVSLPVGVQSNVLLAFYGIPTSAITFPTTETDNYLRPKEALTDADWDMLDIEPFTNKANVPLMYEEGYAGKIYMTINPNTVDVTGLQPMIVNSLDEESPITLTPIKPCTTKLQFGWAAPTRAGNNGYYEADAYVASKKTIKDGEGTWPYFDIKAAAGAIATTRDAITQMFENKKTSGQVGKLEEIASDIQTIMQGMKVDRSGLKVTYTTDELDGTKKEHSVYSQYDLAATPFHPLNLGLCKDFDYQTIPGYEQVDNLLTRVSNTVHEKVGTFFTNFSNNGLVKKLADFKINSIEIPEIDDSLYAKFKVEMDTVVIIDGLSYDLHWGQDVDIPIKFDKNLTIDVNLNGVEVTVPIKINKDVEVDLSKVTITSPTVVVTGSADGTAETTKELAFDEEGNPMLDAEGNPIYVETGKKQATLLVPIVAPDGTIAGYTQFPLDNITVAATIHAEGGLKEGETISLDGKPVATVKIDTTITSTVDIHKEVPFELHIDTTLTKTINISEHVALGWYDYEQVYNEERKRWEYALDEKGHLIPLKDAEGNPKKGDKRGFAFRFKYDLSKEAKQLFGTAVDAIEGINEGLLKDVQDLIDEVNKTLKTINEYETTITGPVDDLLGQVKNFLDKINNATVKFINSLNSRFQPFMMASTSKGIKRLSTTKSVTTKLTKDITLYPTSQTMEMVVPIARKHIGVTNVFKGTASAQGGDTECKAKLKAVNNSGQMNKVLDGTVRQLKMNNAEPGYIYEVAYSVLDFDGQIATRKYYIEILNK